MFTGINSVFILLILSLSLTSHAEQIGSELSGYGMEIDEEFIVTEDIIEQDENVIIDAETAASLKSEEEEKQEKIQQKCFTQGGGESEQKVYSICNNGNLIYDASTGLMWTRCSIGKVWNQQIKECEGSAFTFNWKESLNEVVAFNQLDSSSKDWRLPNVKELATIADLSCVNPAINQTFFPNTDSEGFWTSTVFEQYPGRAWFYDFSLGNDYVSDKHNFNQIRLVRLGFGGSILTHKLR